jgi:hypothetical protein
VNSIISTDTSSDALLQTEPDELFEPSAVDHELRSFEVTIALTARWWNSPPNFPAATCSNWPTTALSP